ncbi:biotin--[acetyl-CoA-carboxylase] ligase [Taylorella equigenitalis]|uniref:biotin--[acetyl-CoA-carboxylase] ligase n=1 Tax=Taylorella equigenitalis TaxID=29575 RepID=UPI00237CD4EB|nr:biotin--[acetyl-CoA-carboxylase] ligase [Taylorella equigenitalis]WDU54892.1 biotin--[acetyl-CoA-carboxylase] ligase [Taylorella equigenitalis]
MSDCLLPSPEIIVPDLKDKLKEFKSIEWVEQIDSTNDRLLESTKLSNPTPRPAILGAHYQTSGRGRHGRKWSNLNGDTLMFSCAYDVSLPPEKLATLAPLAGIVACDALKKSIKGFGNKLLTMKWPNDIFYKDAKLSGLLVEVIRPSTGKIDKNHHVVVVGMGMNLNHAKELSKLLGRPIADWLSVIRDHQIDVAQISHSISDLVALISQSWMDAFLIYQSQGFDIFRKLHESMDALKDQIIDVYQDGEYVLTGQSLGLDQNARLLVKLSNDQIIPLLNVDVSIRKLGSK